MNKCKTNKKKSLDGTVCLTKEVLRLLIVEPNITNQLFIHTFIEQCAVRSNKYVDCHHLRIFLIVIKLDRIMVNWNKNTKK